MTPRRGIVCFHLDAGEVANQMLVAITLVLPRRG